MSSKHGALGVLALVQLVIIAYLWFADTTSANGTPLFATDMTQVSAVDIRGGETGVSLTEASDAWRVDQLPADAAKIEALLEKLATAASESASGRLWPVATTADSAQRFEVTEADFQREIKLHPPGGDPVVLYTGTSPGFERVHIRREDAPEIFAIRLSNFELPTGVDEWLDKNLLAQAQAPDSVRLTASQEEGAQTVHTLQKVAGSWLFDDGPADPVAAEAYVQRFLNLRVLGVAAADPSLVEVAILEVGVGADQFRYTIQKPAEGEGDYVFTTEMFDASFRVAAYVAEQLLMTDANFTVDAVSDEQEVDGGG